MIRKAHLADLPSVLDIWLQTNLEVHSFISPHYWQNNVDYMKQVLPQAEVFVYEDKNKIMGFVGLEKDYIAGIFVSKKFRSQGIGKQILDFLKSTHPTLSLSVYAKKQSSGCSGSKNPNSGSSRKHTFEGCTKLTQPLNRP